MSHSVEKHLSVDPAVYDAEIRRFVPGYEAALDEVATLIAALRSPEAPLAITDLEAGTGALSARLARSLPRASFTLVDADQAMLEEAKVRLLADAGRCTFHHGSFFDALPRCDVAVASLSLHHVHEAPRKVELYANVRRSLAPGGFLVSADATIPRDAALKDAAYARWAAHLVAEGDTEEQAYGRFATWAKEDRYFALEEELAMIRTAGFAGAEVLWRRGSQCVMVATT